MMVAAKAPKSWHYSSSDSLSYRVSAAVCVKNSGQGYISDIFQSINLPVSNASKIYAQRLISKAKRREVRESTHVFKRRRMELRGLKKTKNQSHAVREGESYDSGIALHSFTTLTKF